MKGSPKKNIDDEQPETVEEHFKIIMSDNTKINSQFLRVNAEDLPEWLDDRLFKIGQKYFDRNALGLLTSYLAGLIAVFVVPSITEILTFTNQSSTPCTAFRRYFQTTLHIYNLHIHDFRDSKSKFYKSVNVIRWKHATASIRALSKLNVGITQKDMVLTQFGFIGYILTHATDTSLTNELEEREGINHFWRVIGHLLGIPDRLNLCRKNERETTILCQKLIDNVYGKSLDTPSESFMHLTKNAVEGLQSIDPLTDLDAFLTLFYRLNNREYKKEISLYSKLNVMYRDTQFHLMSKPIIGIIIRTWWNWYFPVIYWFYEKYPLIAWWKYGSANTKLNMYPHGF